jgi:predicted tellurium resistance membrane protein TerC
MWQELSHHEEDARGSEEGLAVSAPGRQKTLGQAVTQIIIADVSMSIDNVLAVAGAAQRQFEALVFGLLLSVVLMGVASSVIAALLARHRWIAWVGLLVIVFVAIRMVYDGADQVLGGQLPTIPLLKGRMPFQSA